MVEKVTRTKELMTTKKIISIAAILGIICIVVFAWYSLSIKKVVKEWDNKIYPGVSIQDVDLGGLNKEEAKDKLIQNFQNVIGNKKLSIKVDDKEYELIYSDIMPIYDIEGAVDKAYNFGKNHGDFIKYKNIKITSFNKNHITLDLSYDEEKLKQFEEKIKNEVAQLPKDAKLNINGSDISVEEEQDGKTINLDSLDQNLKQAINGDINSKNIVTAELETTKPKVTKDDLSKIKGVMGTFSSNYGTSSPGRSANIEIATKTINGTVVMPGEVFSFNDVVGDRSATRGYKEAGTYVGNKVEPGIGGGICQVSTTLYRAAMRANLRSVQRTNHSMAVGYAKPGLDATVAYGYLDYQFKNTYDFPIYICGSTAGKVITYSIYGDPSILNGKTYDMANEIVETIPPQVKVVPDNTLPEGKEVNEGGGVTGYKAKSYQVTYENGVEANREFISTDSYASVENVVRKGTQPVTPPPEEAQAAETPSTPAPETETTTTEQGQAPTPAPAKETETTATEQKPSA